jgi:hypothetical protein
MFGGNFPFISCISAHLVVRNLLLYYEQFFHILFVTQTALDDKEKYLSPEQWTSLFTTQYHKEISLRSRGQINLLPILKDLESLCRGSLFCSTVHHKNKYHLPSWGHAVGTEVWETGTNFYALIIIVALSNKLSYVSNIQESHFFYRDPLDCGRLMCLFASRLKSRVLHSLWLSKHAFCTKMHNSRKTWKIQNK